MKKFKVLVSFHGTGNIIINVPDTETPESLMDRTSFELSGLIDPDQLAECIDDNDIEIEDVEEWNPNSASES